MKSLTNRALLGATWLVWSLAALAAAEVLPDSLQACKREADNERRLQCYDREVAKFPVTSEQAFGLSEYQVSAARAKSSHTAPEVKQLSAKVVAVKDRPQAGFVVTLDNGQVWMQYEMETGPFVKAGDVVSIKPGWLGSFWLVGPSGAGTKVHRVR